MPTTGMRRPIVSTTSLPCALAVLMVMMTVAHATAEPSEGRSALASLQQVVDGLRARLGIAHAVKITIVESNPRVVSMIPPSAGGEPFGLAVQANFLDALTDDEVRAALAHELGHVWVATHHPFLQTERQANDIAMRVVTRYSLSRLYTKLWALTGAEADLTHYLGPEILRVTRHYPID